MTFDECHRLIKKGDVVSLRNGLDRDELNPNLSNPFAWTLLMLAALEGNTSIGRLLISRGAGIDAANDFGETPLSLAAHKGHISFVRMLMASGASADVHPHGCTLEDWLKTASGLSDAKLSSILEIVNTAKHRAESSVNGSC